MSLGERLVAGRPGRLLLGVLAASLVACFTPLPVHGLLAAFGRQGRLAYALGGAVAGALLLHLLLFAKPVLPLAGALAGGLAALAFRRIWQP